MIRAEIVELIQRRLHNGQPSDDSSITDNEINLWVNKAIGYAAMAAYIASANNGETGSIPDSYYQTVKGLALSLDQDTGLYYCTLPSAPLSVPRGLDITSAHIQGVGRLSKPMVRLTPSQVAYYRSMPKGKNDVFYWVEGAKLFVDARLLNSLMTVAVRMVTSAGSLESELNVDEEGARVIIDYVLKNFLPTLNVPQDNNNNSTAP